MLSALFANLVLQQVNMAMMFLGKIPHPQTGKTVVDLDAAQMFIDNLEMIERKTQGNLTRDETSLLRQHLMNARMVFVQTAESSPPQPEPAPPSASPAPESPPQPGAPSAPQPKSPENSPSDDRRKYVKKY
ncbi:MAG: DUF1844 domain-containing protein [Verrucomicrobia bacterium]|nr:DUF1844 domain-containing protein [Verrucomicrobiota bacterium]